MAQAIVVIVFVAIYGYLVWCLFRGTITFTVGKRMNRRKVTVDRGVEPLKFWVLWGSGIALATYMGYQLFMGLRG